MKLARNLVLGMRGVAGLQLVLGIGLWLGWWYNGVVEIHRSLGVLFVLSLWIVAGIAIANRRATGVAIAAIIWGLLVAFIGLTQQGMMVGDRHWIIRVVHLLTAIASMPFAERLAGHSSAANSPPA